MRLGELAAAQAVAEPDELEQAQADAEVLREHEQDELEQDERDALEAWREWQEQLAADAQTEGERAWREYRRDLVAEAFAERAVALGSMTVRQGARRRGAGTPAGRRAARRSSASRGDDSEQPGESEPPRLAGRAAA